LNDLFAPDDAIVVKIGRVSKEAIAPGGGQTTITAGADPLFTLMPIGADILAQVDIQSMDAGFVRVGDPVVIKLDDYRFTLHGTANGTVQEISENSFTLDDNNQPAAPYFRTLVKIDSVNLHDVPKDTRLVPGETLTGDINVGEQTLLQYILDPAMRVASESMREP
jgi:HlyD family secretion protein